MSPPPPPLDIRVSVGALGLCMTTASACEAELDQWNVVEYTNLLYYAYTYTLPRVSENEDGCLEYSGRSLVFDDDTHARMLYHRGAVGCRDRFTDTREVRFSYEALPDGQMAFTLEEGESLGYEPLGDVARTCWFAEDEKQLTCQAPGNSEVGGAFLVEEIFVRPECKGVSSCGAAERCIEGQCVPLP